MTAVTLPQLLAAMPQALPVAEPWASMPNVGQW